MISLEMSSCEEDIKQKLGRVLKPQYMSSEEGYDEDTEQKQFIVRPLCWESSLFRKYKKKLDDVRYRRMKKRSKDQTLERLLGDPSDNKETPNVEKEDSWIVSSRFKDT